MIRFAFSGLRSDYLSTRESADVFHNVEADLRVLDGEREIYGEVLFPVVELVGALRSWQRSRGEFVFDSMALDGRWAVRIIPADGGWQLVNAGDDLEHAVVSSVVFTEDIDRAIDEFAEALEPACVELLGTWIESFFA
ncbi:hypothetical protein [Amycolatopsis sp. NPDC059657]|uniref:DUF7878 domain-containing protein n=1 Tax=Amycolatopsis sp. NPDC059657 TaxID=3346899 RepID=UPI00366C77DB